MFNSKEKAVTKASRPGTSCCFMLQWYLYPACKQPMYINSLTHYEEKGPGTTSTKQSILVLFDFGQ